MKIYGSYTSPYVRHVRIALIETQIPCEFIETDLVASADISPTKKVPFLMDGSLRLSDSSSIIRYLREQAGSTFLPRVEDLDLYSLSSTLLDSSANLFFVEKAGTKVEDNSYLQRQKDRISDGLQHLNDRVTSPAEIDKDALLRLECFLAWGQYRQRFTLNGLENLQGLLSQALEKETFRLTTPP